MPSSPATTPEPGFRPPGWCRSPHCQTLWPYVFPRALTPAWQRERLELDDGDFLDLDHLPADGPRLLILHGLEGSSDSHYVRGAAATLQRAGFAITVLNFRGCSGEPNRLLRSYHAGDTGDLQRVLAYLQQEGRAVQGALGFSLGGNVLLNWLAEQGESAPLRAAATVSVPFDLAAGSLHLQRGWIRFYERRMLRGLVKNCRAKCAALEQPEIASRLAGLRHVWDFDDRITGPVHGFASAREYYDQSSSGTRLGAVRVPTLLIQAQDDPLVPASAIPDAAMLPAGVHLERYNHGGHLGFIRGTPLRPVWFVEPRLQRFFREEIGI
ncbi:MAG: hydrolase [Gammaproteobacteria bacterium]|nr:hydrolase [Gammaproteobacteria bacterium]